MPAAWADEAKSFGSELIVNWGWEMNGDFNPWNGSHNGGETEGPRNFREAYRHIIELMEGHRFFNRVLFFEVKPPLPFLDRRFENPLGRDAP